MKIEFIRQEKTKSVLLIYDGSPADVSTLQTAVDELSARTRCEVQIHSLPVVGALDNCQLVARLGSRDIGIKELGGGVTFEWVLSATGWKDISEMLEPFKEPWKAGHAFLDTKSKVSLIISTGRGW
jgi:hypothetical protein